MKDIVLHIQKKNTFSSKKETVKLEEREATTPVSKKKKKKKKSKTQKDEESKVKLSTVNFKPLSDEMQESYRFLWDYANKPDYLRKFTFLDLLSFFEDLRIIVNGEYGKGDHYGLTISGLGSYTYTGNEDEDPTEVEHQIRVGKITLPIIRGSININMNTKRYKYLIKQASHLIHNAGYPNPKKVFN